MATRNHPKTELLVKLSKLAAERAASAPNLYRYARSRDLFHSGFVTHFKCQPNIQDFECWDAMRGGMAVNQ